MLIAWIHEDNCYAVPYEDLLLQLQNYKYTIGWAIELTWNHIQLDLKSVVLLMISKLYTDGPLVEYRVQLFISVPID